MVIADKSGFNILVLKIVGKDGKWITKTQQFEYEECYLDTPKLKDDELVNFSILDVVGGQKKIFSNGGEVSSQEFDVKSGNIFELCLLVHKAPNLSSKTFGGGSLPHGLTNLWEKWTKEIGPPIMQVLPNAYQPYAFISGVSWFCVYYSYVGMDHWQDSNRDEWLETLQLVLSKFDTSTNTWVQLSHVVCAKNVRLPLSDLCCFHGWCDQRDKEDYAFIVFDNIGSESGDVSAKCKKTEFCKNEIYLGKDCDTIYLCKDCDRIRKEEEECYGVEEKY